MLPRKKSEEVGGERLAVLALLVVGGVVAHIVQDVSEEVRLAATVMEVRLGNLSLTQVNISLR